MLEITQWGKPPALPEDCFQTGFCTGLFDQFPDQTDAAEDYAGTGSRNVWEHAVLDWIMFRAIWRIVGHPDFQSEPVCQILSCTFINDSVPGSCPIRVELPLLKELMNACRGTVLGDSLPHLVVGTRCSGKRRAYVPRAVFQ